MRRTFLPALVVLLTLAVGVWLFTRRPPAIDGELARLPGVVDVRAGGQTGARTTVVHLLDYHLVPREQLVPPGQHWNQQRFGLDPERAYVEHLDAVESVQREHETILRRLASKRGRLTVFVEGLTQNEVGHFAEKALQLAKIEAEDIPETHRMLGEVQAMKQTRAAKATADELRQMLAMHRLEVLKTGATVL